MARRNAPTTQGPNRSGSKAKTQTGTESKSASNAKSKNSQGANPKQRPKSKAASTQSRSERKRAALRAERRAKAGWWALGGVGAVAIVAIIVIAALGSAGGTGDTQADGWDLPQLDGDGRVTLAEFGGKPLVANFFASWCTECDRELPEFTQAARTLEGEVDFVFIDSNETGNWEAMADRHGLPGNFPLAADVGGSHGNGLYRSLGGSQGMPMTAFYDADGNVVDVVRGALTNGALEARVQQLFGAA